MTSPSVIKRLRVRTGSAAARRAVATAVLALAGGLWGCNVLRPWSSYESSAAPPAGAKGISAKEWIGKSLSELTTKLGQPTSVQPLLETTGQLIVYAQPGQPHYVFETGANGKIVSAVATN